MKVILVAFIVIVAFASKSNAGSIVGIIQKVTETCFKKTGADRDQIIDATLTPLDEFETSPDVTEAARCFFVCPFSLAKILDEKKCVDCQKARKMVSTFLHGPDLEEIGACLLKGFDQCCPKLQYENCCKNHYELINCLYPICGESIAKCLTGITM